MNKLFILPFFLCFFFSISSSFAAETKTLLKTNGSWDKADYSVQKILKPEATVLKIKIDKGEKLPLHKHIMVNVAYVVSGKLKVTSESGKEIIIKEGDCLPELINTYHYGENVGEVPVELIVFYLGEKDAPLSILK